MIASKPYIVCTMCQPFRTGDEDTATAKKVLTWISGNLTEAELQCVSAVTQLASMVRPTREETIEQCCCSKSLQAPTGHDSQNSLLRAGWKI